MGESSYFGSKIGEDLLIYSKFVSGLNGGRIYSLRLKGD